MRVHLQLADHLHFPLGYTFLCGSLLHDMCITPEPRQLRSARKRLYYLHCAVESVMTFVLFRTYSWNIEKWFYLSIGSSISHDQAIPCRTRSIIPRNLIVVLRSSAYIIFEEVISQLQNRSIARCAAPPSTSTAIQVDWALNLVLADADDDLV